MKRAFSYRFSEEKPNLALLDSKPKIQHVIHDLSELASTDSDHVKACVNAELLCK
jgi:hypothetical protein